MKLLNLHLSAFGPFTGKVLDLSEGAFHIVFGPNEAGKSSALRAISGFLYGIHPQSTDNFLHENKALRIGATLRCADGRTQFFLRRKGNKDTLLDQDEIPCADIEIEPFLGAVRKDLFLHMFGLSHQRLIEGGKEIVQGKGDAGESIFAAGMGVAGLRKILEDLEQQEGNLFKPAGQKPEINQLLSALSTAKHDLRTLSLSAKAYNDAAAALKDATAAKEKLTAEYSTLINKIARLDRIQKAAPKIATLEALRQEQEALGDVVLLTEDFPERRRQNQEERKKTSSDITVLEAELIHLRKKIDSHPVDNRLMELASEIEELFKSENTYKKNRKDLPNLKHKRHNLREEAQRLLRKLGLPENLAEAEKLRLSNPQKARITTATDELKSLRYEVTSAQTQLKNTEAEIREIQAKLDGAPEVRPIHSLQHLLKLIASEGNLAAQRDGAVAEANAIEASAALALERLVPPLGVKLDELEALAAPSAETIKRFETKERQIKQSADVLDERIRELRETREKLLLKIDAVKKGEEVPTEDELLEQRRRRDHGWQLVRLSWEGSLPTDDELTAFTSEQGLADAYEQAVSKSDATADELRRESDRVAQLQQLAVEQKRVEKKLADQESEQEAHAIKREAWLKEWRLTWASATVAPLSPAEMLAWNDAYKNLLEMCRKIRELRKKQQELDDRMTQWRKRLTEERKRAGLPCLKEELPFFEQIVLTEEAVDSIQVENHNRETDERDIKKAKDRLVRERANLEEFQHGEKEAKKAWGETVAPLGLPASSGPEEAQAILADIGDVFQKLDEAASIQSRVIGIEKECERFEKSVTELAHRLENEKPETGPPQEVIARLNQRLVESRTNLTALTNLTEQVEEKEDRVATARLKFDALRSTLKNLLDEAGIEEEEQLISVENASKKSRESTQSQANIREQLLDYCGGGTVEELILAIQKTETETLPGEIEGIKSRREVLSKELNSLNEQVWARGREIEALDGSEAAAIKAAEIQETTAALRTKIEEYTRLRLASILLRREIERYRKKHQGPILKRAGEFFARLTLGSFSALSTDFGDKDEQILIGLRSDGSRVRVEGMSDGTCDQLYLALRLASLEHHLETNESVPLILDDILVNFDDARAGATLEILAELSSKNQIIYFTHHRHILDIAKAMPLKPAVSFHALDNEGESKGPILNMERAGA
ncbi:MAG: AAA family ATPase [Opitutales bacterium]